MLQKEVDVDVMEVRVAVNDFMHKDSDDRSAFVEMIHRHHVAAMQSAGKEWQDKFGLSEEDEKSTIGWACGVQDE